MSHIDPIKSAGRFSAIFCTFLGLALSFEGAAFAAKSNRATDAGFVAHKALYDISLAGTKSGSQIVNISGKMFYEWEASCDAWISDHRFNLTYEYADSPAMKITSDFSVYEPFDGENISFTSQRRRDGRLFEEMRGYAHASPDAEGGATYTLPDGLEFSLPENTQFPMAHSLNIIEQLKAGKTFYNAVIFDGSDNDGPVEVNTFIGKPANALSKIEVTPNIDMALVNGPAHHVRLAFFPLNSEAETADYEMSIVFHENGIISDMFIEYDDFSVRQKLVALEALDRPCDTVGIQE